MKCIILSTLMLLVLIAGPAHATNPLASDITGYVVDANKRPIQGAFVIITQVETGRVLLKRTNEKGRYLALGLRSDGHYIVRVEHGADVVQFKPGTLALGHSMRRNVVIGPEGTSDNWSWQWNMRGLLEEDAHIVAATPRIFSRRR